MLRSHRRRVPAALASLLAAALTVGFVPGVAGPTNAHELQGFAPQLITVHTPTGASKARLQTYGLDLTEHAGHDYVEVVVHSQAELDLLASRGFTWDVRIADLFARSAEVNALDAEYAAATVTSPLPSGRDSYRYLGDYLTELETLAETYPSLVRMFDVGTSVEGRPLRAIEIAKDVHTPEDGRPVFLMFGLHHAREWPSGEVTIEFAYDLLTNYGTDARITSLVDGVRTIFVPVSNPDGFDQSRRWGDIIDFNGVFRGGSTANILGTPGNAYKRKNCRIVPDEQGIPGACEAASPGGFGVGVDLNRNYGALWGGPGSESLYASPIYRGSAPFSEPETQAIRNLISTRQVTTLISNHTFSNLILRPNGVNPQTVGPDGFPIGMAPDEHGMKELGAAMAANTGYDNIHGWELYDTTGTTEDYSYNATGGYGYTFEVGPSEFHPPFAEVVDEYVGAGAYAGKGLRAAYLLALENAANTATHAVLTGQAPAGATLRVSRTSETPTWGNLNNFTDTVETTMIVGDTGAFTWHVNPSTRPFVMAREVLLQDDTPKQAQTFGGGATVPGIGSAEHPFTLNADADVVEFALTWDTPDDLDLYIYEIAADGARTEVGSSGNFVPEKEFTVVLDAPAGDYVIEVVNYASVASTYEVSYAAFDAQLTTVGGGSEAWRVTCEVGGEIVGETSVTVGRGEVADIVWGCTPDEPEGPTDGKKPKKDKKPKDKGNGKDKDKGADDWQPKRSGL